MHFKKRLIKICVFDFGVDFVFIKKIDQIDL